MPREQMTPWEIEREDPSPDDLDAAAAFYDAHCAPPTIVEVDGVVVAVTKRKELTA